MTTESQISTASAKITCLCGAISEPGSILKAEHFPVPAEICYCDTCRYTSGQLCATIVDFKNEPSQASLQACVAYASSDKVTRYFCKTCGAKTFIEAVGEKESRDWYAHSGGIERSDDRLEVDTIKIYMQIFVEDTKDCGLLKRMVEVAGNSPKGSDAEPENLLSTVYKGYTEGPTLTGAEIDEMVLQAKSHSAEGQVAKPGRKLLCSCHCKAVQFNILSPDHIKDVEPNMEWYLRKNSNKYIGKLCDCRSCRLAAGNPLQAWTYSPWWAMTTLDGEPLKFEEKGELKLLSALSAYQSSENVRRSFCGTCGASVFYFAFNRAYAIDTSVGILRSDNGSLAMDWLEWQWTVKGNHEESRDRTLIRALAGDGVWT